MLTFFKILTPIFGIVAVVSLIGLTDTTHQVFGSDDAMVLAVALVLFLLSSIAWMQASRTEHKASPDKPINEPATPGPAEHRTVPGCGMAISLECAVSILRKWHEEKRGLQFLTFKLPDESNNVFCSGLGYIDELTSYFVRINDRNVKGIVRGDLYGCMVPLGRATGFVVWDWRNVPPEEQSTKDSLRQAYDMSLTIEFGGDRANGARCELYAVKLGSELEMAS